MNIKIKELLEELNLSINTEDILAYIDGSLKDSELLKVKKIVENNLELKNFVENISILSKSPIYSTPPIRVRQKLLSKLGINDHSIFDICIKFINNGLDIIAGNDFFKNDQFALAFRNNSNSEYQFEKTFDKFILKGFILKFNQNELKIHFKILSQDRKPIKNIRIELKNNQELIKSLITDEFGSTNSVNLKNKDYIFSIFNENEIENLSISLKT